MRTLNNPAERATTGAKSTVAPVTPGEVAGTAEPEFMRVEDACQKFGPSRGWFYQGIRESWFKSVLLRRPGAKNGIRLLHVASVRNFLNSQLAEGIESERSNRAANLRKNALNERENILTTN